MKQIFAGTVVVSILSSCNHNSEKVFTTPVVLDETKMESEHSCYIYTSSKDTVNLYLQIVGNCITGDLSYNYFEKDKNVGTLTGFMKRDTLFAEYKFISEGNESVREVFF